MKLSIFKNIMCSVDKFLPSINAGNKVHQILSNENSIRLSKEIHENIIGIKEERIVPTVAKLGRNEKQEVLIEWKEGINGEDFLREVYNAGLSFEVLQRVLQKTRNKIGAPRRENIAINLTPDDFLHDDLEKTLDWFLRDPDEEEDEEYDFSYTGDNSLSNITLEILEEEIGADKIYKISDAIKELEKKYGFSIALDDFDGTAQMYKTYLLLASGIDSVKIDRKFFKDALESFEKDADSKQLHSLVSFIDTFKQNGKRVVIEGIETEELREFAISIGADYLQGYLLK